MEQAALTKNAPGVVPPSPATPPQEACPQEVTAPPLEVGTFPDVSGSLSSILASLGDGENPADAVPPAPRNEPDKREQHKRSVPPLSHSSDNPYPDIMLMPLPRQDALRIKWGLGNGLPNVTTLSDEELSRLAVGADADRKSGSLRLYGMFPSGEAWEVRLTFDDLNNAENGIIIGRDPSACGIVISEDSVSRKHAVLEMTADGLAISDLDSRNGTSVDDHILTRYDRCIPLHDGSTVNLGEVTIRVEIL